MEWDRPQESIKHQNNSQHKSDAIVLNVLIFISLSLSRSVVLSFICRFVAATNIYEGWQEMKITFNIVRMCTRKLYPHWQIHYLWMRQRIQPKYVLLLVRDFWRSLLMFGACHFMTICGSNISSDKNKWEKMKFQLHSIEIERFGGFFMWQRTTITANNHRSNALTDSMIHRSQIATESQHNVGQTIAKRSMIF